MSINMWQMGHQCHAQKQYFPENGGRGRLASRMNWGNGWSRWAVRTKKRPERMMLGPFKF